jgi:hypothetical protein
MAAEKRLPAGAHPDDAGQPVGMALAIASSPITTSLVSGRAEEPIEGGCDQHQLNSTEQVSRGLGEATPPSP